MNSEDVLGFNPKQNDYNCFMHTITPEKAQYILDFHNEDIRPFYEARLKAIDKSLDVDGWCNDGGSMTFNTDGNLTEFQHRIDRIVENKLTVQVPVVVGVKPDVFTKTAPAKRRTAVDEMYRKDKSVVKEDETGLRQVLKREGRTKLTMKNAIIEWNNWKPYIRKGRKIADNLINKTEDYKSWGKEVIGFCALMVQIGEEETAKILMTLLINQVHGKETTLTKEFVKYRDYDAGSPLSMTNTEKSNSRFLMLCYAADRLKLQSDGMIQFGLTTQKCSHDIMKTKGIYRKFLHNPDKIANLAHFL